MAETQRAATRVPNINLLLRRLHGYAGLLTAPTLLFFAFTGVLQVLGLHEARGGYTPPAAVAALGSLHKDQVLGRPHHHHEDGPVAKAGAPDDDHDHAGPAAHPDHDDPKPKFATTLLKAFVIAAAIVLMVSTTFGVWMGLQDRRRRGLHLALFAAGVAIPLVLTLGLL